MADDSKRYFWLKLKEDFFQDEAIEWLEEQVNGKDYVLFYLKLCLKSLKNNGVLIRQVGNMLVPYDVSKLAEITKTSVDTVAVALKTFEQIGLVEVQEGGQLYLAHLKSMVGSESATLTAQKQKRYRERKKLQEGNEKGNANVTSCYESIESRVKSLENRTKSIESESKDASKKDAKPTRHKYGTYKNILLSDEDLEKLKAEFPTDWENWIERVSEYVASKGKPYRDYLATIRRWARTDREKKQQYDKNSAYCGSNERLDDLDDLF